MLRRNDMSSHLPSNFLCSSRGKKIWTAEEDNCLKELVESLGTGNWTLIAQSLPTRTGKQCRERWHNHLGAGIKKGEWTEEEDRIIINMQRTIGNQWAKITKMLPGRTDNAVKNRFHATERAKSRGGRFEEDSSYQQHLPMYNPSGQPFKTERTGTGFHHNLYPGDGDLVECSEDEDDYEVDESAACINNETGDENSATDLMDLDIISFDEEDFAFDQDGTVTFDPSAGKAQHQQEIDPCCFNFDWGCNSRFACGSGNAPPGPAIKQEPVLPPQPQHYPMGGYSQQQQQQHFQQQQMVMQQQYQQQQQQQMAANNRFPNYQGGAQRSWI